ncbi:hypothetical protein Nepgr_022561 [Nepenthes gracilis]|uniref:BURP domain-containing protein n=1 Tax=Nepenthes gracilis TaxID=150966 RepID=A0AAD3T165_NEPGR|nr:hypothetical protein Nepgr_022561 [Nepenthes gracilis]
MKNRVLKLTSFVLLFFSVLLSFRVSLTVATGVTSGDNPFTPKAYLIRYWNNRIYKVPRPQFLLSKASPLTAAESASFAKLASQKALSSHLDSFCKSAKLFCFPDMSSSFETHDQNVNFATYSDKNFTNYGTDRVGGVDAFGSYSPEENVPIDTFRRYSRNSAGHGDSFTEYAPEGNVISQSFNTYGTGATGGEGQFTSYADNVNVPGLKFTSYSDKGNGRLQSFSTYSDNANSGDQSFSSYGKNGNGLSDSFLGYGDNSNIIGSGFSSYNEAGNGGEDNFTSYGLESNVPENNFKNYADGGNTELESFSSYRDQSNVGDDSFQSYAKKSNSTEVNFANYGQTFNEGTDKFTGYGKGSSNQDIGFKIYGVNNTFKDYAQKGVTFARYMNTSNDIEARLASHGKTVNRWVEQGKFFREKMLKTGVVIPMPDIRDKMPQRSFLPRSIASKIPFSSSTVAETKEIFHALENSSMESIINSALQECERPPSLGETKRCVGSAEDMIDFAVSVLGSSPELRTTENVNGSRNKIMIGSVRGINGGDVTTSVSCHQSLYPYLLYYCHSVPKVRVYEADIFDPISKSKINHGVAICHLDTSAWSATHGAFLELGSGPGKIEVCHWIFENDMTWTIAD